MDWLLRLLRPGVVVRVQVNLGPAGLADREVEVGDWRHRAPERID